ncbi:MAG: cytidine deaminase [Thermoclostridium sp.]|nr:cytidine deaminase [Thermoclostridium sp.]
MRWDYLVEKALEAKKFAYVPYSGFHVGAAVLTLDGSVFTGCNVENVSYGAAICAERTAIVKAVSAGYTEISAIAITSDSEELTFPCGICRQVIAEFGTHDIQLICANKNGEYKEYGMNDILPNAFNKEALNKV